jgi:predicted transcriptional regulator
MSDGADITPDPTTKADATMNDNLSKLLTEAIEELMRLGLVEVAIRDDGEWVYKITKKGRKAITETSQISNSNDP